MTTMFGWKEKKFNSRCCRMAKTLTFQNWCQLGSSELYSTHPKNQRSLLFIRPSSFCRRLFIQNLKSHTFYLFLEIPFPLNKRVREDGGNYVWGFPIKFRLPAINQGSKVTLWILKYYELRIRTKNPQSKPDWKTMI